MKRSPSTLQHLPPRLSMDEYADFAEASLRESDPVRVARQKELEERIMTPFRLVENTPVAEGGIYNVGPSKEVVILDLAKLIFDLTEFHPAVESHPAPPGSVRRRLPELVKIRRLGFCETVPLEQEIRRCLNEC